jgi:ABC-2 type transport system permease protein
MPLLTLLPHHAIMTVKHSNAYRRIIALIGKESLQMWRDPSSIGIGVLLPVILVLLFGYGLSLDVKNVQIALVLEDVSPEVTEIAAGFELSPYFQTQTMLSMPQAMALMADLKVDAIVRIRPDFARQLALGQADIEVILQGADANYARLVEAYAEGAIGQWLQRRQSEGHSDFTVPVKIESRLWFNEANNSRYFLVPGLIVLVMTLIGAFLTALVMAREWERGTLESLFVTPVKVKEIMIGKTVPYFLLGLTGLILCLVSAKFLFDVPFRGSVAVLLLVSMLYLLVSLGIGLLISSAVKNQFVASQIAVLTTFLPALMLSGFLFDIRSMPFFLSMLTRLLPARYYVDLLQTIFLAGDVWAVILPDIAVLILMATFFLWRAAAITRKSLE